MYLSIKPYKFINFASSKKVVPKPNPNSDYKREDVYINGKCQKSIYDNNNGDIFVINYDDSGKVMLDPIVSNCELEIDVAQLNIFQAPINSFNQEAIGVNGEKDGIILTAPKLITDSQEMQFRLHVPQGLTISGTTNRYFIEVALRGAEIRTK